MTAETTPNLFERCFEHSATPLLLVDRRAPSQPIVRVNASLEALLGRARQDLEGYPWRVALAGGDFGGVERALRNGAEVQEVASCRGASGHFWARVLVRPLPDGDDEVPHVLCALHDVSRHMEAETASEYLSTHDPMSGLVRAHVFEENLSSELVRAIHQCYRLILCYVDIDKFGVVNETYGFATGDRLIRCIAELLSERVAEMGFMCRMAGDEFVVAIVDRTGEEDQFEIGRHLLGALHEPLQVGDATIRLTASVGVACFPDTATGAAELMQQAALAARAAKREGGNDVQVFSSEQRADLVERLKLGGKLRGAVQRGELELHYQPVIGALKRDITGMEALVRWRSPELGLIMPDRFIPLAEDFGMIAEIGRWVLEQACMQARRWLDHGVGDFTLSVNVSGLQMRGRQLIEDVSRALRAARLPAQRLELELTESVIMTQVEHVASVMKELRKMGVKLAMDDFGVGQSSLGYLQKLSVNRLKIDRSFVAAVPDNVNAARICRAVIGLAHEFGFTVVAEGVETPVQLAFLERNGCEFVQGNFFSMPVEADAMLAMLRRPVLRPRDEPVSGRAGSVLLVDDEQNVLRALARLLRRDGYRIFTASSFHEAFEILGSEDVAVVVSDHRMPDGKGTEFLGRVKETHPHTIRMILSGYADLGVVTEAINGGAVYRFLTKPWKDDDLRRTLREAMRMAQAMDEPIQDRPRASFGRGH